MSRFGVRRRLRRWLAGGGEGGDGPPLRVRLDLPDGRTVEVTARARYTVAMASQNCETPVEVPCRDGDCGACVVDVLDGRGLAGPGPAEVAVATASAVPGFPERARLACHARIEGSGAHLRLRRTWSEASLRGD